MFAHLRHRAIGDILNCQKQVSVQELQRLLAVSPATIRRDIDLLERAGQLVRTHGGVVHPDFIGGEQSFSRRAQTATAAKAAIATAAAKLVPDNSTVFVDSGTTCLEVGRLLLPRAGLTLFTNSLPLLAEPEPAQARIISIGGELRRVSRALVGGISLGWLKRLHFDLAFIGCSGLFLEEGASTTELTEASLKHECASRAGRAILLADSSKWERPMAVQFAPWTLFKDIVTDHSPNPSERRRLEKFGVHLHHVQP